MSLPVLYTPRPMNRIFTLLPGWLALWLVLAAPSSALDVREAIWGFDGKLVPGRFNPVSVLMANDDGATFDGVVALAPSDGAGNARGAEYVLPVFLAPRTTRWLQFQIFVGNYIGNYSLTWGRSAEARYEFPTAPAQGPPACVWLRDTDNAFGAVGALKAFPDALFPTTAAATDALDAVVLDHSPNWEPARRGAFRQWIERGGTVHLLPGPDGRYPQFSDELAVLNSTPEQRRVGAGRIVYHRAAPREMSEAYLAREGFPARTLTTVQSPVVYDLEAVLFRRLASLTRPNVNWTAINLLALAYIGVIGPLHFRYRRRLDYRISIVAFLGAVAVFGTAFAVVGRRGYGESQTVHSLGIARALGGGRCDVTQWISAFATDGALYTFTHQAPANLYATETNSDSGSGQILNGKDGQLQLDIPLYSSRAFLHRAIMPGDDTSVTIELWEKQGDQLRMRLRPGAGFPKEFSEARIVAGGRVYELTSRDGALVVTNATGQTIADKYSRATLQSLTYQGQFGRTGDNEGHHTMMPLLAARAVDAPGIFQPAITAENPRTDHAQLLLVAPAPATFHLQGKGFSRERGWILYVQDLFKP